MTLRLRRGWVSIKSQLGSHREVADGTDADGAAGDLGGVI